MKVKLAFYLCTVKGGERCELLQLVSLLAVQFGVEHPELLAAMKLPLLQLGQDPTASVAERATVSRPSLRGWCLVPARVCVFPQSLSALGLCAFIQGSDDLVSSSRQLL